MRPRCLLVLTIALSMLACGGGGDDGVAAARSTEPASPVDDPTTTAGDPASEEVPMFLADLSRVCTTQVGFGGVDAYAPGTGTSCEFDSEGESVRLELVDAVFELTVYEAATGAPVGQASTLEATSTECPYFASFQEGDTQYVNEPTDDQYINALRPSSRVDRAPR